MLAISGALLGLMLAAATVAAIAAPATARSATPAQAAAGAGLSGAWGGMRHTVATSGTNVFLGVGARVARVAPAGPTGLGETGTSDLLAGVVNGLAEAPSGQLVVAGSGGVQLLSSLDAPRIEATWARSGLDAALDVAVDGDLAYVLMGSLSPSGINVYRISQGLEEVGHAPYYEGLRGRSILAAGGFLYIAGSDTVVVASLTDPLTPVEAGRIADVQPQGLAVAGGRLFVAGAAGLGQYGLLNPASPILEHFVPVAGGARGVAVHEDAVFVAGDDGHLGVYAAGDLLPLGGVDLGFAAESLAISGERLYAVGGGSTAVVDISAPRQPELVAAETQLGSAADVALRDGLAFVAGDDRLWIMEDRLPEPPTSVASIALDAVARRVVVAGDLAIIVTNTGLMMLDVSVPAAPRLRGTFDLEPAPVDVAAQPGWVAVSDADGAVHVVSTVDPDHPTQVALLGDTSWNVDHLAAAGSLLLATDARYGLRVVDLTTPAAPVDLGGLGFDRSSFATGIAVDGSTVYVASGGGYAATRQSGLFGNVAPDGGLFTAPRLALALASDARRGALDRPPLEPAAPRSSSAAAPPPPPPPPSPILVIDLATPAEPRMVDQWDPQAWARDLSADAGTVWATSRFASYYTYGIAVRGTTPEGDFIGMPAAPLGISARGSFALVAASDGGLIAAHDAVAGTPSPSPTRPTPSATPTTIVFPSATPSPGARIYLPLVTSL